MARPSWHRLVDLIPLGLGIALVASVLGGFAARLVYPYDLEWMEGGMLAHAWRLQRGLPLYPEPGPDFIPFVYPPGYAAVVASLGRWLELGPALGRGVALAGTAAAVGALLTGVARQGRSAVAGVFAACVFLGTWPDSGAFLDLARPDTLSLALLAWALVLGLERARGAEVASGLLLAAAWVCKHNAAAFGVPVLLGIAARDGWRPALRFGLSAALPALGMTLALQALSEGRFLTYLLTIPASHPVVGARIYPGIPGELGVALGPVVVGAASLVALRAPAVTEVRARWVALAAGIGALAGLSVLALDYPRGTPDPGTGVLALMGVALGAGLGAGLAALAGGVRRRQLPWEWVYGGGVVVTALVTAGLMRGHHGGFLNVLMPLHWVLALGAGVAVARARLRYGPWAVVATALLVAAQLALQWNKLDVERLTPTAADVQAGDRVVAAIRERCEGPVLSPYASWLPIQAGLEAPSVHLIAIWDIVHHEDTPYPGLEDDLREAARSRYWDCVVEGGARPVGFAVARHYRPEVRFQHPSRALIPKTGWRVRPEALHVPRE